MMTYCIKYMGIEKSTMQQIFFYCIVLSIKYSIGIQSKLSLVHLMVYDRIVWLNYIYIYIYMKNQIKRENTAC